MKYKIAIGLEVHVELNTKSKMFCACPNDPEEKEPNVNICPVCLGHPGTLPVINEEAIKKTIKTGLALNCRILEYSKFDRKNYFYPDLPKGYQISQYDKPLCKEGYLEVDGKRVRIRRIHLEEDTGRLIHQNTYSLVDFNRAGVPLLELVTEPDINSARLARLFAQELQLILRYLDVSQADMEKGQMRVEANISLSATSNSKDKKLGTKVEIKNLNSFRAVERAINYEVKRQERALVEGKKIIQETRGWDDIKGITFSQREKEEAHDYRYFPDPDLPPLKFGEKEILEIRAHIPELPSEKRIRFNEEYSLTDNIIEVFVQNKALSEYYEKVMSELYRWMKDVKVVKKSDTKKLSKLCANYLTTDLQGLLKGGSVSDSNFLISAENFAEFIVLIYKGDISSKIAKEVLLEMFETGAGPSHIIAERSLHQIKDEGELESIIKEVVYQNQRAVNDFKSGKKTALQFLIGQVMSKSGGRADPERVSKILKRFISQ